MGPSGSMLNGLLARLGITRDELWIINAVKVRPVRDTGAGLVNRPPRTSVIATYRPIVTQEIQIIQPRVILCLGAVAAKMLIHPDFRITQEHGEWYDGPDGSKLIATYHPSNLLRLHPPDDEPVCAAMLADVVLAWEAATVA